MEKYDELLTAKSWIIMNFRTGAYMRGLNVNQKRQIASLTKMYTLYGCLQINKQMNINPLKTYVKVVDLLSTGSTANLAVDRYILLEDLYYALMLPSGNDAAALLGFYYGCWLDK
jgi:D-alanyl-D-alanine carboxypeptidase (penicillin-binding protein 5/6)